MGLRNDPKLWWNLSGVVAAYQPVRAPDSLLARYNMAHGGDARYMAVPGVLPAWSGVAGWVFSNSAYLMTGIVPQRNWSLACQFSAVGSYVINKNMLIGTQKTGVADRFYLWAVSATGTHTYGNGLAVDVAGALTNGNMCIAGPQGYYDGVVSGATISTGATGSSYDLAIGGHNLNGVVGFFLTGRIQAIAIYARTLSPAEVWHASRQMAYCDVNPDWSVWAPRRKWFPYVLATPAGRAGVYGARPTVALPGGVRIVPQSEGGVNG